MRPPLELVTQPSCWPEEVQVNGIRRDALYNYSVILWCKAWLVVLFDKPADAERSVNIISQHLFTACCANTSIAKPRVTYG